MKRNLLLLLSFVITSALAAQIAPVQTTVKEKPMRLVCVTPLASQPLFLVNGIETSAESLVLAPERIERIDVLKDKKAVEKYGDKAANGVILITTKPGVEFYTLNDFVNDKKNKAVAQVELNGKLLPDMKKLLIDKALFSGISISANMQLDEENCEMNMQSTLVITTQQPVARK